MFTEDWLLLNLLSTHGLQTPFFLCVCVFFLPRQSTVLEKLILWDRWNLHKPQAGWKQIRVYKE